MSFLRSLSKITVSRFSTQNAITTARSLALNRTLAQRFQISRFLSKGENTTPLTQKVEPSPVTQACAQLPENKLQSIFLFHRLNVDQVPSGWSNDPKDLEKALSIPVQDCGDSFKEPMPVLVFIHHHEVITWYIFEASGKYYLYSRLTSSLHQIDEPGNLDEVLAKLAESGTERVRTVHVGRVYGDDLECGSLMAAS